MAKGNSIIVSEHPMGRRYEGTLKEALKPGAGVTVDVSEGIDANGNMAWEQASLGGNGHRGFFGILLPFEERGMTSSTAYVAGDHCKIYIPLPGDLINVLIGDIAGTGDDLAFGDKLILDHANSGRFRVTTGTPEAEPFQALEAATDPTADFLALAIFSGM